MAAQFALVHDLGEVMGAADINPVIVTAETAVAVDALILPRGKPSGGEGGSNPR